MSASSPRTWAEAERRRSERIDAEEAKRRAERAVRKRLDGLRLGPYVCADAPGGPTVAKALARKGPGKSMSIRVQGCVLCGGDHERVAVIVGWRKPRNSADVENVAAGWSAAAGEAAPPPDDDQEPRPRAKRKRASPAFDRAKAALLARLEGGETVPARELRALADCGEGTFTNVIRALELEAIGNSNARRYRLPDDDATS